MKYRVFICLLIVLTGTVKAQAQHTEVNKGRVVVKADSSITLLLRRNAALNENRQNMPGYRVQVYFGTDRAKASEIRNEFQKDHAGIEAYLIYQQPNFKVRVGDYKTRLEAVKGLQLISAGYPNAFIVKDDVRLPKFE